MTTSDPSEPESARQNSGDETAGVDEIANQEPGVTEANSADDKSRNRLGRAAVATLIGLVLVGLLQWNASETDHQFSNMATVLLVFLIGGYVLFQIHCLTRVRWNSFVVPGACLLVIAGFIGMWEFEGFSGELVHVRSALGTLARRCRVLSPTRVLKVIAVVSPVMKRKTRRWRWRHTAAFSAMNAPR